MYPLPQLLPVERCSSGGESCTVSSAERSAVIHTSSAWLRTGSSPKDTVL